MNISIYYYTLYLCLSIILMSNLMKCVSALYVEGIANGAVANEYQFKYQAAIIGRPDRNVSYKLFCSGAVVSPSWILSVAHCFMLNSVQLKQLLFSVVVGSSDLSKKNGILKDIVYIYTNGYNNVYYSNDIAMAKTEQDFVFGSVVDKISIAQPKQSFFNRDGIVSGYGSSQVRRELVNGRYTIVEHNKDFKLRNTTVKVLSSLECYDNFLLTYTIDKFCGVSVFIKGKYTGACWDDAGSPLVINNTLVGISSICYEHCNDTIKGSLYIELSKYYYFIQDVLLGNYSEAWLVHIIPYHRP